MGTKLEGYPVPRRKSGVIRGGRGEPLVQIEKNTNNPQVRPYRRQPREQIMTAKDLVISGLVVKQKVAMSRLHQRNEHDNNGKGTFALVCNKKW